MYVPSCNFKLRYLPDSVLRKIWEKIQFLDYFLVCANNTQKKVVHDFCGALSALSHSKISGFTYFTFSFYWSTKNIMAITTIYRSISSFENSLLKFSEISQYHKNHYTWRSKRKQVLKPFYRKKHRDVLESFLGYGFLFTGFTGKSREVLMSLPRKLEIYRDIAMSSPVFHRWMTGEFSIPWEIFVLVFAWNVTYFFPNKKKSFWF